MIFLKSILLLSILASSKAEIDPEDCPCFSRDELKAISDVDELLSCRESHATGSGIGIFEKMTDETQLNAKAYSISMNAPYACRNGHYAEDMNTDNKQQAENCANFIRERCVEINDVAPIEF